MTALDNMLSIAATLHGKTISALHTDALPQDGRIVSTLTLLFTDGTRLKLEAGPDLTMTYFGQIDYPSLLDVPGVLK